MARHRNNNSGFTLIEMLTVVILMGILGAIALPSLNRDKSFTTAVPQIESTLKILSLKARGNSGNPYRITLQTKGTTVVEQFLKVEYLPNNNCTPANDTASITAWETNSGWRQDPNQTFAVPDTVQISNFPDKGLCFNGKGEVVVSPGSTPGTPRSFDVSYIGKRNSTKANKATIRISLIGDISRDTYPVGSSNANILNGKFN
jgi:prepilin-type N-terminal cleavage/methylation domain-containing protein